MKYLNNNKIWLIIKNVSPSTSKNPNMALCGVNGGIIKLLWKKSFILVHRLLLKLQFAKRWTAVYSSSLQKEQSFVFDLWKINSISFKYKTLCSVLYWKYLNWESIVIVRGRLYISFQFKLSLLKYFWKYSCEVGLAFLKKIEKE